jgi:hypothetical protein
METRASYAVVGGFVLLLAAGLFAFFMFIAKVQFDTVAQTLSHFLHWVGYRATRGERGALSRCICWCRAPYPHCA